MISLSKIKKYQILGASKQRNFARNYAYINTFKNCESTTPPQQHKNAG